MVIYVLDINPSLIKTIALPQERFIEYALNKDGLCIKYVSNPSLKLQKVAVSSNPLAISYISNPCLDVQIASIEKITKSIETIFMKLCYSKINNGYSLSLLYNKVNDSNKAIIKMNPNYKDDAKLLNDFLSNL